MTPTDARPLDERIERLIARANEIIGELDRVRGQIMQTGTGGGTSARTDALISLADVLMAELDVVVRRMAALLTGEHDDEGTADAPDA